MVVNDNDMVSVTSAGLQGWDALVGSPDCGRTQGFRRLTGRLITSLIPFGVRQGDLIGSRCGDPFTNTGF